MKAIHTSKALRRRASPSSRWLWALALALWALWAASPALANDEKPDPLRDPQFEQRLNEQVPLDLTFTDDSGQSVTLGDYFGARPVILSLGYYECPMLCPLTREGLLASLQKLDFVIGKEFTVVSVSINPHETTNNAAAQKATYAQRYGRPGATEGWHFLTGQEDSISKLAQAIGFRYVYDEETRQYAHPSGIVVATPQGKVSRYLYGIAYEPRDLRLGLVEASNNVIGTPIDQLLLLCYHYDPSTGKYTVTAMNALRAAGILTTLLLGGAIYRMSRRHRRTALKPGASV